MAVVGPFKGATHDVTLFREETKPQVIKANGIVIADSIYQPGKGFKDEIGMFLIPNSVDEPELKAFKSRVRARHESFNARIKRFNFARDVYRGVDENKHGKAFKAICTIVQYQMDNGCPIFSTN